MQEYSNVLVESRARVVVDTSGPEYKSNTAHTQNRKSSKKTRKNSPKRHTNNSVNAEKAGQWPLEANPILHAVLDYAKKVSALTSMKSSVVVDDLIRKIKELDLQSSELDVILYNFELESKKMKDELAKSYSDDV